MSRTLTQKLGIKPGYKVWLVNIPDHYFKLLIGLPEDIDWMEEAEEMAADFIHVFVYSEEELERLFPACKSSLKKNGMLWVSWPKKTSSISTDLHRDYIREYILHEGLVDTKVAAVDQDWSGIKFMYRRTDR
ncbi:MAG: DUF3052 domain-containing protein [Bacteroidota bacterium]